MSGAKPNSEIWLQWHGDTEPDNSFDGPDPSDVTWSQNRIWDHDVRYVRADLVDQLANRLKRAEEILSRLADGYPVSVLDDATPGDGRGCGLSDTPETDRQQAEDQKVIWGNPTAYSMSKVNIDFARKLERERDEARNELATAQSIIARIQEVIGDWTIITLDDKNAQTTKEK